MGDFAMVWRFPRQRTGLRRRADASSRPRQHAARLMRSAVAAGCDIIATWEAPTSTGRCPAHIRSVVALGTSPANTSRNTSLLMYASKLAPLGRLLLVVGQAS